MKYVSKSQSLEEINLSNNVVPKGSWVKLTNTLRENRSLRNLEIGFNTLLEEQSWRLASTIEQPEEDKEKYEMQMDVPLSAMNQELMDGLMEFIKYNPMLFHLDLQTTGLPAQVIRLISHMMTRATSL